MSQAPNDVKKALMAIGFSYEDINPTDDPAYTKFMRGKEVFTIMHSVKIESPNIADTLTKLFSKP